MGTINPVLLGPRSSLRGHLQGMLIELGANASGTWQTIATGQGQSTGLRIEAISGHNSGIYYYSGQETTYTYAIANGTIRTLWTGSGTGGCSCRMVVNGSPESWSLQLAATSNFGTNVYVFIGAALNTMIASGSI